MKDLLKSIYTLTCDLGKKYELVVTNIEGELAILTERKNKDYKLKITKQELNALGLKLAGTVCEKELKNITGV